MAKNFVDDMVNVMWSRKNLAPTSYPACKKWCHIAQWKLGFTLNQTKYEMIPPGKAGTAVLKGCAGEGVRATQSWVGTDLGGDLVAGSRRR